MVFMYHATLAKITSLAWSKSLAYQIREFQHLLFVNSMLTAFVVLTVFVMELFFK